MLSITPDLKRKIAVVAFVFVFSFALRLLFLNQMGRTWDEMEYVGEGYRNIELLKKGDFNNSYFYTHYDKPPLGKFIYGISAHLDLNNVSKDGPQFNYDFTYSRIVSAFFSSLAVAVVALFGYEFFNPFIGISSGTILAMLPFFLGLSQIVTLESLTMFFFTSSVYSFLKFLKKKSLAFATLAGIFAGMVIEIKQSNGLIFIFFICAYLCWYIREKKSSISLINYRSKLTILAIFIGCLTFFLIFPFVIFHTDEIMTLSKGLWTSKYSIPEVFLGGLHLTPVYYYVVMFFITTPIIILTLFVFGFYKLLISKKWLYLSILIWFLVPFLQSFFLYRQHGIRYIIEIYAPLAIISAHGIEVVTKKFKTIQKKHYILLIGIIFYLSISLWRIHPYYLNYFNELVGGTDTVYRYRLFQIGWWGDGMREAGIYRDENIPKRSKIGLAISPTITYPYNANYKESIYEESKNYDYVIVNFYHIIRDEFDDSDIKKKYDLIYQVKADNSTLVFVYKKKPK